ncbi:STM4015 family protein [Rubellicoccus peritrichatus]|uniref:STM4015 family protein n=1 Tax=Rubellicoccus peritrichatus TaxID=3080537 RepID=A0AAQ3L5G6_9BACT|nr:STM4015 family protein [Puniceicoccus sp. CR14]WOO39356.1 STM4015 family protein [Puniceicoccus sp. CR14]
MKRCELVYMDAKSSKFWNLELNGSRHSLAYGRIGTDGQKKEKDFDSEEKAEAAFHKLVKEKMAKGYVEAAGSGVESCGHVSNDTNLPLISFSSINHKDEVYDNVKTFVGKRVLDYDPEKASRDTSKLIYRFRSDWDEDVCEEHLKHFIDSDASLEATGIIIGAWHGDDPENSPESVIKLLIDNKERLPKLAAIYLGDITSEENEMSWIYQTDVSPLFEGFPQLQLLRTRGGQDLALSKPDHPNLRALALESGGLPVEVIRSICTSNFPNLEYLEIWLGTDEYGGNSSVQDLQPILAGKLFPKLKYLGLRNCDYVDDIAGVIVNSPIIDRIETLDLSLGTLTDAGAKALLSLPQNGTLKKLNIHHHYVSGSLVKELNQLDIAVDTSNPSEMEDDDEWRFVAVGE